jgi:LDH2 family malate/lactate/ureidoglycolate dehydrogenase
MDYLISIVRAADKMEGIEEILLPGEPQWKYFDEQSKSGIQVDEATMKIIQEMAKKYSVELSF